MSLSSSNNPDASKELTTKVKGLIDRTIQTNEALRNLKELIQTTYLKDLERNKTPLTEDSDKNSDKDSVKNSDKDSIKEYCECECECGCDCDCECEYEEDFSARKEILAETKMWLQKKALINARETIDNGLHFLKMCVDNEAEYEDEDNVDTRKQLLYFQNMIDCIVEFEKFLERFPTNVAYVIALTEIFLEVDDIMSARKLLVRTLNLLLEKNCDFHSADGNVRRLVGIARGFIEKHEFVLNHRNPYFLFKG